MPVHTKSVTGLYVDASKGTLQTKAMKLHALFFPGVKLDHARMQQFFSIQKEAAAAAAA